MPIASTDLVWRPAKNNSTTTPAQNGGICDLTQLITTNVKNNVFADVSQSERLSGSSRYRKVFFHVKSPDNQALINAKLYVDAFTPSGDCVLIYPTDKNSTEANLPTRACGIGMLKDSVAIGATSVTLNVENPALYTAINCFNTGDWLYIRSGSTEDFTVITNRVVNGDGTQTLTFAPALLNAYAKDVTLVSSIVQTASVLATVSDVSTTSTASFNANGISVTNRSAIDETWTLTFSTATVFSISGAVVGAIGSGNTNSTTSIANPATGSAYFSLAASCFTGQTYVAGNTITFKTNSSTVAVWVRREIPAGTAAFINNSISIGAIGES